MSNSEAIQATLHSAEPPPPPIPAEPTAVANSGIGVVAAGVDLSGATLPPRQSDVPRGPVSAAGPHPARGVVPAADCGCGGSKVSNVFALGTVSFDFGTEARRDSFRQLMPEVEGNPKSL